MTKEKKVQEEKIKNQVEELESDDIEMEKPQTKEYKQYLVLTDKLIDLLNTTLGALPYNTIFGLPTGQRMRMADILKFVNDNREKMQINDMNQIIAFLATAPYNRIKPLMEYIEDKNKQTELWKISEE